MCNIMHATATDLGHICCTVLQVVPEPVDKWQNVGKGKVNLLMEFYKAPERFAYTFQNYVFLTRVVQVGGATPACDVVCRKGCMLHGGTGAWAGAWALVGKGGTQRCMPGRVALSSSFLQLFHSWSWHASWGVLF